MYFFWEQSEQKPWDKAEMNIGMVWFQFPPPFTESLNRSREILKNEPQPLKPFLKLMQFLYDIVC